MRRRAAKLIVKLRFILVPLWIALAVLAFIYLPSVERAQGGGPIGELLPKDSRAVQAETLSKKDFPYPLVTRTLAVAHDESGLSPEALRQAARTAQDVRQGKLDIPGLAAVVPVPNTALEPEERLTTILYYLYFRPEVNRGETRASAERFANAHVAPQTGQAYVGVTGSVPAADERGIIVRERLPLVELATAVLILLAVGIHFRSPVAPLVSLATVLIAFVVASRSLTWVGQSLGIAVPSEVAPIVVVLVFGVVTDYSIFFLSRFRERLREGTSQRDAAELASFDVMGIVLTAGLVVAVATGSLLVAGLSFFQVFGPALAIAVLIGALVAVTFVPGVLAFGGRFLLWPASNLEARAAADSAGGRMDHPGPRGPAGGPPPDLDHPVVRTLADSSRERPAALRAGEPRLPESASGCGASAGLRRGHCRVPGRRGRRSYSRGRARTGS